MNHRELRILVFLLLAILASRLLHVEQPIVENYVGRQVPTAMVARDLTRGGGFLQPQLQTGPFPNYFLVEPPIYAGAAGRLSRLSGWPLGASGRIVSAFGAILGALGIYGLTKRRSDVNEALLTVAVFGLLPVAIRYGRSFQPDSLALGMVLAGLALVDPLRQPRTWRYPDGQPVGRVETPRNLRVVAVLALGGILLTVGVATRVLVAFALVPWVVELARSAPRGWRPWKRILVPILLAVTVCLPAAFWYLHARTLLEAGSRASADSAGIWGRALIPSALLDPATLFTLGRFALARAFTPIGVLLMALALWYRRVPAFWVAWLCSGLILLLWLAGKSRQEYYWMMLAPGVAAAMGAGFHLIRSRGLRWLVALAFAVLAFGFTRSTWETPAEWRQLDAAREAVNRLVPTDGLVVAPEAVLFAVDRRGCRLEKSPEDAQRAAGEWGLSLPRGPVAADALIEDYRRMGAIVFVDVGDPTGGRLREALHERLRRRYDPILVDEPGLLIIALSEPRMPSDDPVTLHDFARWKSQGKPISMLTAYDATMASLLDAAGVDSLLVGDSLGTVVQGRKTTLAVTLDQMIYHAEMVARAARRAFVIADLPFLTYQASVEQAMMSAGRLLKETGCSAVKLEGGRRSASTVRALVEAGIPVMGHVGLTPQSVLALGGYLVQRDAEALRADAQALAEAGAFALVVECVPAELGRELTAAVSIPTIGIGAGPHCDGQVLVAHDMLGLFEGFQPRFVRRYAELAETIRGAAAAYVSDVTEGRFPDESESFLK